ncbi:VWA domain-containing protein [Niallia sp. MER TA 168]|uniref:vWA domain-containing protein n=1 Tax=Niallia sp. MER TA 168 TaxID=2939568 RepID=UPI00204142DE|nr:VWA domain-containing protein [Niallia sp. MER TA 168]MCM3362247.1 VWA domain-containing protein [Niallia sp. MER TA 168]
MNDAIKTVIKPLPVILLLDTSGSMYGEKADAMNKAVRVMLESFKDEESSMAEIYVSIITFGGRAQLDTELKPARAIQYEDLEVNGGTPLGGALKICSDLVNNKEAFPSPSYRPTIVLVSDGGPTDNWEATMNSFVSSGRTSKCDRWALAIGSDADYKVLGKFLQGQEKRVMEAADAAGIHKFFELVTNATTIRTKSQDPNVLVDVQKVEEEMEKKGTNQSPFLFDDF